MEDAFQITMDGQEVQKQDVNLMGATAGLADDRVLAEILRLAPYDGTNAYKAILPYSTSAASRPASSTAPVVVPTGSGNGSVQVNPFRAVVGSRNAANGAPSPSTTNDTDALANWRDVRSGIFTGGPAALSQTIALAANSSGNARWDLVYAQITPDAGQNAVVRRVKDPSSGAISTPSVPQYIASPVVVQVVTGTPGGTPTPPVLPADAAGNYCIPLAWVRVPSGFGSTSTVLPGDIRSNVIAHDGATPVSDFRAPGGGGMRPANGNNDGAGTYATGFPWSASASGLRPGPFLPPDFVGGDELLIELDFIAGSSAGWSHQSGTVVDNSVDWRNRIFPLIACQGTLTNDFANNNGSGATTNRVPLGTGGTPTTLTLVQMSNSIGKDGLVVAGASTVSQMTPSNSVVASGAIVGLYVDPSSGAMKVNVTGSPACRLFVYLKATAPFPNP